MNVHVHDEGCGCRTALRAAAVQGHNHDVLCPAYGAPQWTSVERCGPCEVIRAVREDERERAWNRGQG